MLATSSFERWAGIAGLALVLVTLLGCRSKSIEYVGKAGKSLGAHSEVIGSVASICEIPEGAAACAKAREHDEIIRKSIEMLATYGVALEKLSGKSSVGAGDFADGAVTLNRATGWVDLGGVAPDAIKAGAKILDRIIASGVRRKVIAQEYPNLVEPLEKMERVYIDILKGQLLLLCEIDEQIANNLETLAVLDCETSPDPACATLHPLLLMQGNELRARLHLRRKALYGAAGSLSMFFAAHAAMGDSLDSKQSDADVLKQMKTASNEAKARVEAELAAAEAERHCPYEDPAPMTQTLTPAPTPEPTPEAEQP